MINLLLRLHRRVARRRLAVVAMLIVSAAVAVVLSLRLKLSEDFTGMLPLADPLIAEQFEAMRLFPQANRLFADVALEADEPDRLARAADAFAEGLRQIDGLDDLRDRLDEAEFQAAWQELQAQWPLLLGPRDLEGLASRLEPTAISNRLVWFKQTLAQPQGFVLKDLLRSDPVGLGDFLSARTQELRAGFGGAQVRDGRITSADGRHVLLSAAPVFPPSDRVRSARLVTAVLALAREVETQHGPGVHVAVTGAHRVTLDNTTIIQRDAALTSGLAVVCVIAFIWIVYRRLGMAFLSVTPPILGGLAALGVLSLSGDAVSAIVLGCGSLLIGITDDYGNHMLYHSEDVADGVPERRPRRLAELVLPLTSSALVTLSAFLLLLLSPVPGHRHVGLFAAAGVLFAALFAVLLLPGLIPHGRKEATEPRPLTAFVGRVLQWRDRHARRLAMGLLAVSVIAAVGCVRLRFDGDMNHLNGVTPATRQDEATLRAAWEPALAQTALIVTAPSREEALRKNEAVYAVLETLAAQGVVASFSSMAPLWPSASTGRAHLRAWTEFWGTDRCVALSNALGAAASSLGFRPEVFGPFLERLSQPALNGEASPPTSSALNRWSADYLREVDGRVAVCTLAKLGNSSAYARLREAVRAVEPGALLLNKVALGDRISQLARKGLGTFALLVLGVDALLLLLLLGRWQLVLVTLLPIVAAIGWTLGTLGLVGIPINLSNCIFVIFIVGVGIDYSLFVVTAKLAPVRGLPDRLAVTAGAVTVCAFTTWLGIGLLALARHPALFSVGVTAVLGMTFSLVATLFLVPTCMDWLLWRRQTATAAAADPRTRPDTPTLRQYLACLYRYQGPPVEQYVFCKLRLDPLYEFVSDVVPRVGRILDVGCGYGITAHWLALDAPERTVVGLDHDADKIHIAKATAAGSARLQFRPGDALAEPWPACDVVLLCDVLHYFPGELKRTLLCRARQALSPGGLLLIRDGCTDDARTHRPVVWSERLAVWTGRNKTAHGLHFETKAGYVDLVEKAGFTRVCLRPEGGLGSNVLLTALLPASMPVTVPRSSP